MIVGIDAANIRAQGGLTHLKELLAAAVPEAFGIRRVIVWSGASTLAQLPERPWLVRSHQPALDGRLPARVRWQQTTLSRLAGQHADVLFLPGGTYLGDCRPFVAMPHNILPFDAVTKRLYGLSAARLRFFLLERVQQLMLSRADGLIFLTEHFRRVVTRRWGSRVNGEIEVIPHGVAPAFFHPERPKADLGAYSWERPFRWLYVSSVHPYKHPWHVATAVARLREEGIAVALDLVGPARPPAARGIDRLRRTLKHLDPGGEFLHFHGDVPYRALPEWYRRADGVVFASSCENMPITLLEGMASGAPIACSNREPMRGIFGESGPSFDPENAEEIAHALRRLLKDPELRRRSGLSARRVALGYSWKETATRTFAFLARIAERGRSRSPSFSGRASAAASPTSR